MEKPSNIVDIALVILVALFGLLFDGVIFGWPALQLILEREGVYGNLSEDEQTSRFVLIYNLAAGLFAMGALPNGMIVDALGPARSTALSGFLLVAGFLLFGFSDSDTDAFIPSYMMIAAGGNLSLFSGFPAAFVLPKYNALFMSAKNCFLDAGVLIFALFSLVHDVTSISRKAMFCFYGGVAAVLYPCVVFLWIIHERRKQEGIGTYVEMVSSSPPTERTSVVLETDWAIHKAGFGRSASRKHNTARFGRSAACSHGDTCELDPAASNVASDPFVAVDPSQPPKAAFSPGESEGQPCDPTASSDACDAFVAIDLSQTPRDADPAESEEGRPAECTLAGARLDELPLRAQIRSRTFFFLMLYCMINVSRATIYLGTVAEIVQQYAADDDEAAPYIRTVTFVLVLGVLGVPLFSQLLHRFGFRTTFHTVNVLGTVYALGTFVPSLPAQVATAFVYTFFRAFLFSAISSYGAKMFGVRTVGRTLGLSYSLAAVFSFMQIPGVTVTNAVFDGDYRFFGAFLLLFSLPSYWATHTCVGPLDIVATEIELSGENNKPDGLNRIDRSGTMAGRICSQNISGSGGALWRDSMESVESNPIN